MNLTTPSDPDDIKPSGMHTRLLTAAPLAFAGIGLRRGDHSTGDCTPENPAKVPAAEASNPLNPDRPVFQCTSDWYDTTSPDPDSITETLPSRPPTATHELSREKWGEVGEEGRVAAVRVFF